MKATKIVHNNENRIKIDFPFNQEIASKIRQIADARWSKTHGAWHIPYKNTAFNLLKNLFPEIVLSVPDNTVIPVPIVSKSNTKSIIEKRNEISLNVVGRSIILKMPKNNTDVQFIRSFRYFRWDKNDFCWIVPNYPGNLDLLKDYFKQRITRIELHEQIEVNLPQQPMRTIQKDELLVLKTNSGRLKLIFGFNKPITLAIKKIPYCIWDANSKWWTVPYSDSILEQIKMIAQALQRIIYQNIPECHNCFSPVY